MKPGMFVDIGRGNVYSNRGTGNFVAQTAGVPATLSATTELLLGINVGDKIRTLAESPLQLSNDATVVGITFANGQIHLSSQVDAQGVPLPSTNNVAFSIQGGAGKKFSIQMTAASDGSTMVIDDFVTAPLPQGNVLSCVPQYSNAYLGFQIVGRGVTWVQTGNPSFIARGRITSFDPSQRQFTVDPPLDSSLFDTANTVTLLPPRESRQILRYARYTGLLTRDILAGSATVTFPDLPSAPPFEGRASTCHGDYIGLYVTVGDDAGTLPNAIDYEL